MDNILILLPSSLILYVPLQSHSHSLHWNRCNNDYMTVFLWRQALWAEWLWQEGAERNQNILKGGRPHTSSSVPSMGLLSVTAVRQLVLWKQKRKYQSPPLETSWVSHLTQFPKRILMLSSDLIGLSNGALTKIPPRINSVRMSCLSHSNHTCMLF
jgi:hypothetical protein